MKSLFIAAFFAASLSALDLTFHVQETTNNPATDHPVTVVIPVPAWTYADESPFRVTDGAGATVPAQIAILNKAWLSGYVRHLLVTFKTSLSANEKKPFHLKDDGGNTAPSQAVSVTETGSDITVNTGPLQFRIKKQNFNLFDEVLINGQQIIAPSADNGGIFVSRRDSIFKSSDATSLKVVVEEAGPLRAVIRAETPTVYLDTARQRPGHAVRIYAYAGKSLVRVDYTLKNSAFVQYAWPLFFKDFSVRTRLTLGSPTVTIGTESSPLSQALGSGLYLYQKQWNQFDLASSAGSVISSGAKAPGWLDVSDGNLGVTTHVRYFWETWPNGIEVDANKDLYVRMFPKWGAGYYWSGGTSRTSFVQSSSGLHWLDDMQHLTKEIYYDFHGGNVNSAAAGVAAKLIWKNPVGVIPVSWYASTRVTADMGGIIPYTSPAPSPSTTDPEYAAFTNGNQFGWPNFEGNIIGAFDRKSSCEPGDIPFQAYRFMATENPLHYYQDRAYAYGDLNVRPEWMGGELNFTSTSLCGFTSMPYSPAPWCNYSWRHGWGGYGPTPYKIVAPYLSGTDHHGWTSRDFEHFWIYQVEDFYYYDGMPLIKDFYKWIGQYCKGVAYDLGDNRYWRIATRGHGHVIAALMGAYKMTGDSSFVAAGRHYLYKVKVAQDFRNGQVTPRNDANGESSLMVGYLTRGLIRYAEEQKNRSSREFVDAFGVIEGLIQWNYNWGNWCYYTLPGVKGSRSGTSMPLADPEIWMYLNTGDSRYKDHTWYRAMPKMYGDLVKWNLTSTDFPVFAGRLCQYAWENPRPDSTPPSAITDLAGQVTQPASGLWIKADSLPANQTLYFAVRSFDSTHNMSALSNIYSVNLGSATSTFLTFSAPATAAYYHARWAHKPFRENDSSMDTTAQWYFWAGNAIGNDINMKVFSGVEKGVRAGLGGASLSVFPNPFKGSVTVQAHGAGTLRIYDAAGRRVADLTAGIRKGATVWNAKGMTPGVYFVRGQFGKSTLTRKVILAD